MLPYSAVCCSQSIGAPVRHCWACVPLRSHLSQHVFIFALVGVLQFAYVKATQPGVAEQCQQHSSALNDFTPPEIISEP